MEQTTIQKKLSIIFAIVFCCSFFEENLMNQVWALHGNTWLYMLAWLRKAYGLPTIYKHKIVILTYLSLDND